MTHTQLLHDVAARTRETVRTIRRLGFQRRPLTELEPEAHDLKLVVACPRCRRPVAYPGLSGDGSPAMAECARPRCDLYFDFDPAEVYAARA